MAGQVSFPGVTLLITHYNRSGSLERLLSSFRQLNCSFEDIVVSDDASKVEHQDKLKALQSTYNFRIVGGAKNGGLGANINKGQDAVKTPYTVYVQEDFLPTARFPTSFKDAINIMNERADLDIIRFWAHYRYPTLKPYKNGFGEMKFSPLNMSHLKFFQYSDTPHLRRSNFLEKFGRYKEGIGSDITEYKMAVSFLQHNGKGLFFENYSGLLTHENPPGEPSTVDRASWRQSTNPALRFLRFLYLRYKWLKCTLDVKFMRL